MAESAEAEVMNVSAELPAPDSGGNLSCPEYSDEDFVFLDAFSFWVEGVLQVGKVAALSLTLVRTL